MYKQTSPSFPRHPCPPAFSQERQLPRMTGISRSRGSLRDNPRMHRTHPQWAWMPRWAEVQGSSSEQKEKGVPAAAEPRTCGVPRAGRGSSEDLLPARAKSNLEKLLGCKRTSERPAEFRCTPRSLFQHRGLDPCLGHRLPHASGNCSLRPGASKLECCLPRRPHDT